MAGGADPDSIIIRLAVTCFCIAIPINVYGWVSADDELFNEPLEAGLFSFSHWGVVLLVAGSMSTFVGLAVLAMYFSPIAGLTLIFLGASLSV